MAAWARRREDARRCVVPPYAVLVSAELAEPGCLGKWGQPQARCRTDPLSLLLPPPPPPPPRPVRRDPRPQTPTSFRSARAPQARPGRRDGRMSGGRRKEEPPQPLLANGALKVSVWSKVLRSDAAWEDKVRWGLARAHVRGAGWDSGTNRQARACPCPRPGSAECSGWWGGWPKGVGANSEGPAVGLRAHYGVA